MATRQQQQIEAQQQRLVAKSEAEALQWLKERVDSQEAKLKAVRLIDWDTLFQEFSRFRSHVTFVFDGPLSNLSAKQQAGWLGTWIGEQGREVYKTLAWGDGEKEDPDKVLDKFANYIRPRKNKRIARHRFKQRKQGPTESFDNFLKDLRVILMDCEYADPDDMLIDSIIAGVREKRVQERMLERGESLTLSKAIELSQQFEVSQRQMKIVREEDSQISTVSFKSKHFVPRQENESKKMPYKGNTTYRPQASFSSSKNCTKCGKDPQHKWNQGRCPAKGSVCSYCHKPNHWVAVCHKRAVNTVSMETNQDDVDDADVEDMLSINMMQSEDLTVDKWVVKLEILSKKVTFRIDTGAKCNTLTLNSYQLLDHKGELQHSDIVLRSYSNHRLKPVAAVNLQVKSRKCQVSAVFEILDIAQENVLSGATAEALGLIVRLDLLKSAAEKYYIRDPESTETQRIPAGLDDFPELTRTTGTMPGKYTIKLESGAKGVVHPVRRQPAALREKIIEKLHEMEKDGYIAKVEQPTEWVSSMVAAVRNGKVRICIDPSDLNKVIKREHHPMRTVEEVVSMIPGAKVFSVLDAKSGFLQIELDETSSFLTTFNTPIGRFRRGKDMELPDTLSRAQLSENTPEIDGLECISMLNFVSVSDQKYAELKERTKEELSCLQQVIQRGWPEHRREVPVQVQPYWDSRSQLTMSDDLLFKGLRIVVPPTMREHMLKLIHQSHLGIVKSKQRAREALYWPGMSAQIEEVVRNCSLCADFQNKLPRQPLKPTETPEIPFEKVASDLFEFEGKQYILFVDYYSKFIEVNVLRDTRSCTVIETMKAQFGRHGIPATLRTDNGPHPQYSSEEFKHFCMSYSILHVTSSPHTPHSNGEAERAVQTVKRLWHKAPDKHLALLDYRTTPLESVGLSPVQLLMGRRPRNKLPTARELLAPTAYDPLKVKRLLDQTKENQKYYDRKRAGKPRVALKPGDEVRMQPHPGSHTWSPAVVVRQHIAPRSYVVDSGNKEYRRNSQHLRASTPAANRPRHWIREEVCTEPPELTAENEQTIDHVSSLFQEKQAELQSAVVRVDQLTQQLEDLRRGHLQLQPTMLQQGPPTGSQEQPTFQEGMPTTGPAALELRKLYQELQARNRQNLEQSSNLAHNKELLNKRNAQVTVMDKRIGDLRERLHKKRAEAFESYEWRWPPFSSVLPPLRRWYGQCFRTCGCSLPLHPGGRPEADLSPKHTPFGQIRSHSEEEGSVLRKPSSQWKVSDLDIILSPASENGEGPRSPQGGNSNNILIKENPVCVPLSIANDASWLSISKSASDWRAASPEQVQVTLNSSFSTTIWLRYLPQCDPPGSREPQRQQLLAPLCPRHTELASGGSFQVLLLFLLQTIDLILLIFFLTSKTTDLCCPNIHSNSPSQSSPLPPQSDRHEPPPAVAVRPYVPDQPSRPQSPRKGPATMISSSIYSMYLQHPQAKNYGSLNNRTVKAVYGKPLLPLSSPSPSPVPFVQSSGGGSVGGEVDRETVRGLSEGDVEGQLLPPPSVDSIPRPLSPTKLTPVAHAPLRYQSDADLEVLRRRLSNAPRPLKKRSSITEPEGPQGPNIQKLLYQRFNTLAGGIEGGAGNPFYQPGSPLPEMDNIHSENGNTVEMEETKHGVTVGGENQNLNADIHRSPPPSVSVETAGEAVASSTPAGCVPLPPEPSPSPPCDRPEDQNNSKSKRGSSSAHSPVGHIQPSPSAPSPRPPAQVKRTNLKKSMSERTGHGLRVKFNPLALLLDASLEGEFDLVENPSTPNDEGITPLHNAVCAGHHHIVKFLLDFGVNVNAADSDGWTPLHCAASCNSVQLCKMLVESGAAIFATTISDVETAADKCEEMEEGYAQCSQFLYGVQEKLGVMNKGAAYALWDYNSQQADELTFSEGEAITILRRSDDVETEWWWARLSDRQGYVPRNLLGVMEQCRNISRLAQNNMGNIYSARWSYYLPPCLVIQVP
ncbi:Apoptosis-stimulating of p53 protein 1 [Merluccius polli]|uniref:Apoptosis-stimulating of p53 protein 1 n=1 Tax=Merluccius polli TaxID=89951 RepID=A0AA47NCH6_MERPO|nr:Apoptosis-stimulating of p53 protein 1 [Merluccius polli]